MSSRRVRRLTRTVLVAMAAVGLVYLGLPGGADDDHVRVAATSPGSTVQTPHRLFDGQLIVEGIHGFTSAEVARIGTAARTRPLTITDGELYVLHGSGTYNELPLATMVADAPAYGQAVNSKAVATALSRGVVVANSAAHMFGLRVGTRLRVASGPSLPVTAVVDDRVIGGYQLAAGRPLRTGLGTHADYVMVPVPKDRLTSVETAIQRLLPDRRLRFTLPAAGRYFSPMGDVLSQSQLDQRFGTFLVRHTSTGIKLDPRWISAYITEKRVVQLGAVICNRNAMTPLIAAMKEITRRGLGKTINTADFTYEGGCWNPRTVRFGHGMISHHAWGAAVDINVGRNPLGARPRQDSRLVAIMAKYGFTWGGPWLRHDGAHFEWVGSGASDR